MKRRLEVDLNITHHQIEQNNVDKSDGQFKYKTGESRDFYGFTNKYASATEINGKYINFLLNV